MPRGGKRPGTGSKLGVKRGPYNSTITKAEQRESHRRIIDQHVGKMLQSQIAHAIGIGHLYTRSKDGKFSRIENAAVADRLLTEGVEDQDYYIFMKDPSTQAFTDLMNRAYDKPKEQEQEHKIQGTLVVRWADET